MKTIYELNEKDIMKIVADKFDVYTDCVYISYNDVTTGYGVAETTKPVIKIKVTIDKEIDDM